MSQLARKNALRANLMAARDRTLWLLEQVPEEFLKRRVHSFYSPIGWHFGHIGRTEEYWVMSAALGMPVLDEKLTFLFADLPENPKDNRVNLPSREQIVDYLRDTRDAALGALDLADLDTDEPMLAEGYGWEFALQHECQHQETIAEMLCLIHREIGPRLPIETEVPAWKPGIEPLTVKIEGGGFCMGSDDPLFYDNEKMSHMARVDPFEVSKYPVTAHQWSEFMDDGGYKTESLWSEAGWEWRSQENAQMPEYWVLEDGVRCMYGPQGIRPLHPDEPASCLSWFEAEAYCRWAGKRLPTEPEWEYMASHSPEGKRRYPWGSKLPDASNAASGLRQWWPAPVGQHPEGESALGVADLAGGVWEWTSSPFLPYPGFEAFPYDGYSKDHMLGAHQVCRGGSWATAAPILRCTFRNWYVPTYRQGFLGMRCVEA